ncbi:MAG TPA: DUF5666 domain-containing protein [Phycisphaerales bacterium]|nr:DUF5666 domain-containing protein [Phycisphaerales bacterium]HRQ75243.1 DUF5666 domain-containing protein [Phycisphaerales bacterium]
MKRLHLGIMCAALALPAVLGASVVSASELASQSESRVAEGTIKSINLEKNTFVLTVGKQDVTVTVNGNTKYILDGKDSTRDAVLKVGNKVKATHTNNVASRIEMTTPKS